jgi:hypothetical protein
MLRMLIVGYCCGLCSERRLTQEVELHLAYRCSCRDCRTDKPSRPDHKNSQRRLRECHGLSFMPALVKGWLFSVVASIMVA